MATVLEDQFTGTNGAVLDTGTWVTTQAFASATIQSNKASFALAGGQAPYAENAYAIAVNFLANPNFELICDFSFSTAADAFATISTGNGSANTDGSQADGYSLVVSPTVSEFDRYNSATKTNLAIDAAYTVAANAVLHVRWRQENGLHSIRLWQDAATEPTTWKWQTYDNTLTGNTKVGLSILSGSAGAVNTVAYDFVKVVDLPNVPALIQSLGTQVSNAAATTTVISFVGAVKPQPGDLVVMYGARDDLASDPLTGDSFSDGTANSYTRVVAGSLGVAGTALDGVVGVMFFCVLTANWPAGTNTLTWTHGSLKAAMQMEHWGYIASARASGTNTATSAAGAPSVALTTPVAGDLVLAMEALEYSTAGTSTGDNDTTNGIWSTISGPTATTGTTLAAVKVISQFKVVNATGTQTYNPTHSVTTNVDTVAIIAAFVPTVAATVPPMSRFVYQPANRRAANW